KRKCIIFPHSLAVIFIGFCVLLFTYGCSSFQPVPDTILFNGKLITMDSAASLVEAVAIRNGKIIALGDDRDILSMARDATRTIDLEGHTVIPGLIEGHAHTVSASQSEYYHEIPPIINVEQTLQWIGDDAKRKKPGEWIIHPKFFFTRLNQMRQLTKH